MNNRPPPYNPYMYNVATAPPMDNFQQVPITYQQPLQNYINGQPSYPPPIYTPPPFNYQNNAEQYRREEIERRTRREQDECCCIGILATLCCCFMSVEV
jgi:hypothetical protein